MAHLMRSLRRLGNTGAVDNAASELDRSQDEHLIIEALASRVRLPGSGQPPSPPVTHAA